MFPIRSEFELEEKDYRNYYYLEEYLTLLITRTIIILLLSFFLSWILIFSVPRHELPSHYHHVFDVEIVSIPSNEENVLPKIVIHLISAAITFFILILLILVLIKGMFVVNAKIRILIFAGRKYLFSFCGRKYSQNFKNLND
jgi:hypothetical protein